MSAGLATTFWQKTRWPQAALMVSVVLLGFATSPAALAQNISLTRGGHTYILYKDAVTYSEAYAAAQQVSVGSESGYLMIIDAASENASIRKQNPCDKLFLPLGMHWQGYNRFRPSFVRKSNR